MKKVCLLLVLLMLLPWMALADGPVQFAPALQNASPADFARACEEALADTSLAGSTVAEKDGAPVVAWDEYNAFAAMVRPDGLLMLCHFAPAGDTLQVKWHNDLLLSHYQDIAFTVENVRWTGGILPDIWVDLDHVQIQLQLQPQIYLRILGDCFARGGVRVVDLTLYYVTEDLSWVEMLSVTDDCLAEDIYLATCKPDDWRRGEREEEVVYGW
ncbi:MAG: hypothetical protein E7318_06410 [Clostridiales bacterium]|nr:hypothetical protein [Clostridiales bacterium]